MMRFLAFMALCGAGFWGAACSEPAPAPVVPQLNKCNDVELSEAYDHYVEPFVSGAARSSCSQCHFTGVDISIYAQDTPCQTMACMVEMGAVDLAQPSESEILSRILMGDPASSVFDVKSEHAAILEWIEVSATCHAEVCGVINDPCGSGTGAPSTGRTPAGNCSEEELVTSYWDNVLEDRGRCISCHQGQADVEMGSFRSCIDDSTCVGEEGCFDGRCKLEQFSATPFLSGVHGATDRQDPEHWASATTGMYALITMGLIDAESPLDSRLLVKPLQEGFQPMAVYGARTDIENVPMGVGVGLDHGGATKFHMPCPEEGCVMDCRKDTACESDEGCGADRFCNIGFCRQVDSVCDETYVRYLTFVQDYLACQAP
jgi:hypothetical protein